MEIDGESLVIEREAPDVEVGGQARDKAFGVSNLSIGLRANRNVEFTAGFGRVDHAQAWKPNLIFCVSPGATRKRG